MNLKSLLSLFLIIFSLSIKANTSNDSYRWLHAQGFAGMQSTGMAVDNNNNTYFYGFAYNDVEYDNNLTTINFETDYNAIVVVKVDAQQVYQWTKKIHVQTDPNSSFNVRVMDVDDQGNMYFGGDFVDSVTVNAQIYSVGDAYGYFLMKTDASGSVQWFKAGSNSEGHPLSIKYTAGRIAFQYGWSYSGAPDLFGTDLQTKFGSIENFEGCDMVVGALSASDGHLTFAQGIKTNHGFNLDQLFGIGIVLTTRNTLEADVHGNLYVSGGFKTNTLKVAGTDYTTTADMSAENSQFVLRVDALGAISWVKLLAHASGLYPTLALNDASGVAALFPGSASKIYVDDQQVDVSGEASNFNHIALFGLDNGDLLKNKMINDRAWHISPALDGRFCVAGNIKENGQNFGMDWLYNTDTLRNNLFVGFLDKDLNTIAGQSVISTGVYKPYSISTGADGKIRLLGDVNYTSENNSDIFPFGDFKVIHSLGSSSNIYSVLDPKQLIKADLDAYPMECNLFEFFVNPTIESEFEWYVNDTLKGTDRQMTNQEWGGYSFGTGTNYIRLVLTDSTDIENTLVLLDTVTIYDPTITINTEIFSETGLVNYNVTVDDFAPAFRISIDRGNYNYDTTFAMSGSYIYEPGEQTISVILNTEDNWNCFYRAEKTFIVPEPGAASLNAISELSDIRVYSQILQDRVQITNCPPACAISVYNQLGQEIHSRTTAADNIQLNSSYWSAGVYLIKIENRELGMKIFKVIKY